MNEFELVVIAMIGLISSQIAKHNLVKIFSYSVFFINYGLAVVNEFVK